MTMKSYWEVLASYLSLIDSLINSIVRRIYSYRNSISGFGVEAIATRRTWNWKKFYDLILIDEGKERTSKETHWRVLAFQCRIPRTLTVKNRPPCRGD